LFGSLIIVFCVFMLANKIEMIETVFDHSREMLVSLESRVHLGHLELMAFLATEAHRYLPKAKCFVSILHALSSVSAMVRCKTCV